MSTGLGPYAGTEPDKITDSTGLTGIETTLVVSQTPMLMPLDIGGSVMVNAEVYNGAIPGPTFRLNVGDSVVVRLVNNLPYDTGIHWHGVELENYSDGTEVTQDGAVAHFASPPPAPAPAGGTFLYKFKVTRPGLFWYHPHHHNSINRVFRGLYGLIIVTDPAESSIVIDAMHPSRPLPAVADTMQLVLSDITVCKAVNDTATYVDPTTIPTVADRPEWLSGATVQNGPTPKALCEMTPAGSATNDDGMAAATSYAARDVPSVLRDPMPGIVEVVEGQTVLTNGVNVGPRPGTPLAPQPLPAASLTRPILSGQGLRLQIVNCAHLRYFRLLLTRDDVPNAGQQVNLVRIGGEGGLLDSAILEGGTLGTFDTKFTSGEILLPPGGRADVVAAIPAGLPVGSVLTLWTRDYQRTGGNNPGGWSQLPTVPVMHLKVTGAVAGAPYTIAAGTALRVPAGMMLVEPLGAHNANMLDPMVIGKPGKQGTGADPRETINLTAGGSPTIDGVNGMMLMMSPPPYTSTPHIGSSRYAEHGKLLELKVANQSGAHHPFHLHGFSFQPRRLELASDATKFFQWSYQEFRDTIDIPANSVFTFRIRLDERPLSDDVTPGGALGRWLFHCHIFFHHHHGMISELVVTSFDGREKPNVNVGGSWEYKPIGMTATRKGTFYQRDGLVVNLTATLADGTTLGNINYPPGVSTGTWTWTLDTTGMAAQTKYVYITADDGTRKDQAVFRLQIGGTDGGSDIGDPHIHTVDGKAYDFQAAGEFTLLRDRDGMEIQTRQTPAQTPPPWTDINTGLTDCVSLNTAVAARVGSHRISYQPGGEGARLTFFVDGKPAPLPTKGIYLDGHRVSTFAAGGETGIRIDYAHGPVFTATPYLWTSYGLWYLDVQVWNTQADEGLMGKIHVGTWLPNLPSGATVGPLPPGLHDRHLTLYKTFADAWRVTDQTSLFVYLSRTSTATFTDRDWPGEKPPCVPKLGFPIPITPIRENIPIEVATRICQDVTDKDLNANCVFDVITTGDEALARGYLVAQDLRRRSTAVQIVGDKPETRPGEPLIVTAIVLPISSGGEPPAGSVTFIIDGAPMKEATKLDKHGRAKTVLANLKAGAHQIWADYTPGGGNNPYDSSSSPNLLHIVTKGRGSTGGRDSDDDYGHKDAKEKKPPTDKDHKKKHEER